MCRAFIQQQFTVYPLGWLARSSGMGLRHAFQVRCVAGIVYDSWLQLREVGVFPKGLVVGDS